MLLYLSKKFKIIFVLIILIFICYCLNGCINDKLDEKSDKVKIVNYSVRTFEQLKVKCCYENFLLGNGFIHGRYVYYYMINGTIINLLDKKIEKLIINAIFLDINNSKLFTKSIEIFNLSRSDFEFKVYSNQKYFNFVENIEFDLNIIKDS